MYFGSACSDSSVVIQCMHPAPNPQNRAEPSKTFIDAVSRSFPLLAPWRFNPSGAVIAAFEELSSTSRAERGLPEMALGCATDRSCLRDLRSSPCARWGSS